MWGSFEIDDNLIKFSVQNEGKKPENLKNYRFGAHRDNFLKRVNKKKFFKISEILKICERSFNLRNCAIEIFMENGKNYFFNLFEDRNQIEVLEKLKEKKVEIIRQRKEAFKNSGIKEKWIRGEISNFDYIMEVNTYAGRTYNDLQQYPVFPWIINNYEADELDLENINNFRDLSLPIGAINKERLKEFKERYEIMKKNENENGLKAFMYGSHYSGNVSVLSYMIRIEPITSLCIKLQNGKFDEADRIFGSVEESWNNCITHLTDVKELIPEFYYAPYIFKNMLIFLFNLNLINF